MTTGSDHRAEALALEHEAVWLLDLVAARVLSLGDAARAAAAAHRRERDRLEAELGAAAPGPRAAYAWPGSGPTDIDPAAARARVADLEGRLVATWLRAVGRTSGQDRADAIARLTTAELARVGWGGPVTALPGLSG